MIRTEVCFQNLKNKFVQRSFPFLLIFRIDPVIHSHIETLNVIKQYEKYARVSRSIDHTYFCIIPDLIFQFLSSSPRSSLES